MRCQRQIANIRCQDRVSNAEVCTLPASVPELVFAAVTQSVVVMGEFERKGRLKMQDLENSGPGK